jgi:hypothetical protein
MTSLCQSCIRTIRDVPVAIFWSVTVYDPITGSGLDNGQPFPSLNTMEKPVQNADGSFEIYRPQAPPPRRQELLGHAPRQRLVHNLPPLRPEKVFLDRSWKAEDVVKLK